MKDRSTRPCSLLCMSLIAAVAGGAGCADTPTAPTSPIRLPSVSSLVVTGNLALTAVGETSQLTLRATFSNGSTQDLTSGVIWSSSNRAALPVSTAGLVTVVSFGQSNIGATHEGRSASATVRATPPGTRVVTGRVREPGQSGIADVLVRAVEEGFSTLTDRAGEFTLAGVRSRLAFEKEGYEPASIDVAAGDTSIDVPLRKIVRIRAGESVELTLAPHDMDYGIGQDRCYPCRMIRIGSASGTLHLELTWNERGTVLNLWAAGRRHSGEGDGGSTIVAEIPVAAGEVQVFVGIASAAPGRVYVPLTLTTSIRPG